jgi:hypothetical protein
MAEDEADELRTEDETDEAPFVEFDIPVSPSDPSLEVLHHEIDRGDIIRVRTEIGSGSP